MYRLISFALFGMLVSASTALDAQVLVVGTYTSNNSPSKGIYLYAFDSKKGLLKELSVIHAANPSYQIVAKNNQFVYSVNETENGLVSSYKFDKQGHNLSLLNSAESKGASPCYLEIDKTGKWIFVSNYSSGNFAVYSINEDGSLGALSQEVQHEGNGPNKSRQQSPHVHSTTISPDNRFLFVCDLGTDEITSYPFDAVKGKLDLDKSEATKVAPGAGPRHMAFSKNGSFAYSVDELFGTVNVFSRKGGHLTLVQTADALKAEKGKAAGADIHVSPNGKFLYVSQRSNSTIEVYKINKSSGKISFVNSYSTEGNFPRNFTIHPSGKWLLVANQKTHNITVFKVNKRTGTLVYTKQQVNVGVPVSLKWISN